MGARRTWGLLRGAKLEKERQFGYRLGASKQREGIGRGCKGRLNEVNLNEGQSRSQTHNIFQVMKDPVDSFNLKVPLFSDVSRFDDTGINSITALPG
jgi:hypothetical protein